MINIRNVLMLMVCLLCATAGYATTTASNMNASTVAMEGTGLVITQNMIGIGTSSPKYALEVNGSVFIKNTMIFDKVDRSPYTVDWSAGNCQRMVITQDGPAGITLGTPPTGDSHLILSVEYNTDTPGKTTFSVPDPTKYALVWSCNVSQNTPISHNIDVFHFYFQKTNGTEAISTYNAFATFWYRKP